MKCLALDFGLKRIGVACGDSENRLAFGRCTLQRVSREQTFADLGRIISAEEPQIMVLGLPIDLDGKETLTTRQARNFAASLKRRFTQPLYFMEEALSSFEAEADLRQAGICGKRRKAVLDQAAAVRILESFWALPPERRSPA